VAFLQTASHRVLLGPLRPISLGLQRSFRNTTKVLLGRYICKLEQKWEDQITVRPTR